MQEDDDILAELAAKFAYLPGKMRMQRARRLYVEAPADKLGEVFAHLYENMQFTMLTAITGLDLGLNLGVIYHLVRASGMVLNLSTAVSKDNPVLQTVTAYFPAADCYERELVDLLGIKVEGLPEGMRYPLPDGWPAGQYPLRKDWKAGQLAGMTIGAVIPVTLNPTKEAKNG